MFTDIKGFTGIAETMSPGELIQLMNDFLTPIAPTLVMTPPAPSTNTWAMR